MTSSWTTLALYLIKASFLKSPLSSSSGLSSFGTTLTFLSTLALIHFYALSTFHFSVKLRVTGRNSGSSFNDLISDPLTPVSLQTCSSTQFPMNGCSLAWSMVSSLVRSLNGLLYFIVLIQQFLYKDIKYNIIWF